MKGSKLVLRTTLVAMSMIGAMSAHADSKFATGTTPQASPSLDFKIIIPKVISFQVGSPGTTIDLVEFDMTAAATNVGDASLFNRTNGTTVPVSLKSNVGNVSVTATTTGALTNATSDTISYSEIDVSSDGAIGNPTLVDGAASAAVTVTPNVGAKVINQTSNWTFKYKNSTMVADGTYGGVNIQKGRVVYTASQP